MRDFGVTANRPLLSALLVFYFIVLSGFLLWPFDFDVRRKNNARWIEEGYGIEFPKRGLLITKDAPGDLFDKLNTGSGITIEVWLESNIASQQGPARIISYSIDPYSRNFTLGQSEDALVLRLRTTTSDLNGLEQQLEVKNTFTENKIHHIAATYNFVKRCIYIDGNRTACGNQLKGNFSNWDSSHKLIIGNEASGNRPWLGKIFYAAIYNRALNEQEIRQNFNAGIKETTASIKSSENLGSGPIVAYMFDEKSGDIIYDKSGYSAPLNLYMPEKIPRGKRGLITSSLKTNIEDISSINNLLINIFGFFPLGFLMFAYLKTQRQTTARITFLVLTVALIISFGFEYLQSFLPNQHSSVVEVILKMLGISLGMAVCLYFSRAKLSVPKLNRWD